MINLKTKLALFNLVSKLGFTALFLIFLPWLVERINLRQADNDLIRKREKIIDLISRIGIEPFISVDSTNAFGSYNILKEEYVSLEKTDTIPDFNFIDIKSIQIEDEIITYRVLNYTVIIDGQKYLIEIGKSLSTLKNTRKNITRIILLFLAAIIIITLMTDLQYTSLLLKPLRKIILKLKDISNPSAFNLNPVKTNTTDFARLDKALRDLMIRLDETLRKEKEITINISHELLTPVSVIRSKLENLLLRENSNEETSSKIEESLKTLYRLQSLINSLLLIARIESNQYILNDSFSVVNVIDEIIRELEPVAQDKGINMLREAGSDVRLIKANSYLIFSMFYNIMNNALRNTLTGGKVVVRSTFKEGRFTVEIEDNGKGMNEKQLSELFLRFKSRRNNEGDGTGIGLAIAKSIADLHNIDIKVSSKPDSGTIFTFLFSEKSYSEPA